MHIWKKNKYAFAFYAFLVICLLLSNGYLDCQMSGMIQKAEAERESNLSEDAVALGEITADAALRQELELPEGVLQVGIRFGTYTRENSSKYQVVLYDNEGNVVAKKVVPADWIEDNQMCYVQLYGKTSSKVSYVIEISSSDAVPGNAVTGYGVQVAEGHSSCTLDGKDTGKELVIELVLQKVFPVTEWLVGVATICLVLYLFRIQMVAGAKKYFSGISAFYKKHKKAVIYVNIALSVFGVAAAVFFAQERNVVLHGLSPEESDIIVQQYSGKWTQGFRSSQDFEAIEVRLATYQQTYQQGELHFSLYEKQSGELLAEERIPAEEVVDNEFLVFRFGKILGKGDTEFYFELQASGFEGQALGLYCVGGGESLQYHVLQKERVIQPVWLLISISWSGIWLLVLVCNFAPIKKGYKQFLATGAISFAVGLQFTTYANYRSFSLEALAKNLGLGKKGEQLEWGCERVKENTSKQYYYDAKGNVYIVYDQIFLENIQTNVDMIELYLGETDNGKKHSLTVFVDQGNGFGTKADIEYEYVYNGEEKITIPIKNIGQAKRLVIGYSMINETGLPTETIESGYQYYSLEKIILNGEKRIWHDKFWLMLAGMAFVWLVYAWKKYQLEERFGKWLVSGNDREAKLFLAVALSFGVVFSVLLPVYQAPDEPTHIRWAFQSIGGGQLYEQAGAMLDRAVPGVTQNGNVTVDTGVYWSILGERLDSYRFSMKPSLDILKYPGQVCGILVGIILHLPIGWIIFLAEFGALLLYGIIGAAAIRVAPIKKILFMMALLMPMAIQQAASFSYDSFNNAIAALTIAYILHLALVKEKVGIKELAKVAGMLFILLWIKKIYVLVGILIFLVPIRKYHITILGREIQLTNKKVQAVSLGILGAVLCLCGGMAVLFLSKNVTVAPMLLEAVHHPGELGRLVLDTVKIQYMGWIRQGCALFGWLDGIIHGWIIWVIALGGISAAMLPDRHLGIWNYKGYFVCLGTFLLTAVGIILSMLTWSSKLLGSTGGILNQMLLFPSIEGVQGRYFLPILVLVFLFPISRWMQNVRKYIPAYFALILSLVISIGYSIFMLLQRYWMG